MVTTKLGGSSAPVRVSWQFIGRRPPSEPLWRLVPSRASFHGVGNVMVTTNRGCGVYATKKVTMIELFCIEYNMETTDHG